MLSRTARVVVALVTLLLLAGCSLRWDTPPPEVQAPDAAEVARQAAATQSATLAGLAVPDGDDAAAAVLADVAVDAEAHLAALGGVWEPWPGAGPGATAYPTAPPAPSAAPPLTAEQALTTLVDGAGSAGEAAAAAPGELGRLLAAVSVSRTFAAADLAAALGVAPPPSAGAPLPAPAAGLDAPTVQALDAARYAFEVVAAQSSGGARETAVERATELGALAASEVPGEDLREVAYDVSTVLAAAPEGTTPQRHLAAQAELDVMTAFLARLASADAAPLPDAAALVAAATHAAGQARSWDAELPALPGLTG
ncbi:hypothetical protein [Georgenia sp. MJ170]|uniref:hypothetical protein n=1 Tax=Georgenia sunbinii TaxID=3117728 RepID=UPI002F25F6BC